MAGDLRPGPSEARVPKYFRLPPDTALQLRDLQRFFSNAESRNMPEVEVVSRCIELCYNRFLE